MLPFFFAIQPAINQWTGPRRDYTGFKCFSVLKHLLHVPAGRRDSSIAPSHPQRRG